MISPSCVALAASSFLVHGRGPRHRRAGRNTNDTEERVSPDALAEFVDAHQTPAGRKLELFHGAWKGSVDPVFREFAY